MLVPTAAATRRHELLERLERGPLFLAVAASTIAPPVLAMVSTVVSESATVSSVHTVRAVSNVYSVRIDATVHRVVLVVERKQLRVELHLQQQPQHVR